MLISIFILHESDCESGLLRKVHSGLFSCQKAVASLASCRHCGNLFLNAELPSAEVQWVIFIVCLPSTHPLTAAGAAEMHRGLCVLSAWLCNSVCVCSAALPTQGCCQAIHLFIPAPSAGNFYQGLISTRASCYSF